MNPTVSVSNARMLPTCATDAQRIIVSSVLITMHQVCFVIGGPGAGKTTQGARLAAKFKHDFVHISLGDVLRKEAERQGSVYAETLKNNLKEGLLGDPQMTVGLLKKAIDDVEMGKVVLIDGLSADPCQRA